MLRIEKIDVVGFKSFPERTTVELPDGVTAVVGPNGCGKSNIADALQWVLGEQSARALRGARMEDVIFNGSEGRGPGGMAEVTVHLVAREEPPPGGRSRVTLTRRLFRTGDSDYLMDGRPARLADIRNLLEQIRAGERTYAIIDQGRVASFVISKPKERRMFIEDAAGISGYKHRRRLAETRLEGTRANLLRVDDILREVERQRRSLQRQAGLARRARRLDEELRVLRTVWFRRHGADLGRRTGELEEFSAVAQTETRALEAERARLAARTAALREALEEGHAARDRVVGAAHQARLEEERLSADIDSAMERARTLEDEAGRQEGEGRRLVLDRTLRQAEAESLHRDLDGLNGHLRDLEAQVAAARDRAEAERGAHRDLTERAGRLERELFEKLHERAEITARLSAAREAFERESRRVEEAGAARLRLVGQREAAREQVQESWNRVAAFESAAGRLAENLEQAHREEETAAQGLEEARHHERALAENLGARAAEKATLDSLAVRLAGADAAREVLERAEVEGLAVRGVLAEALSVDREMEGAAEAYLADTLPAVLVDSGREALRGAGLGVRGRLRFLPLDLPAAPPLGAGTPEELLADPRVRGRLSAHLHPRSLDFPSFASRLKDAFLVDGLEAALDLHRRFPGFTYLTPEGHAVDSSGMVTIEGGGQAEEQGLLARARRREELAREVEALNAASARAGQVLQEAKDSLHQARLARQEVERGLGEKRQELAAARMAWEQAGREAARLEREVAIALGVGESAERGREEAGRRSVVLEGQVREIDAAIAAGREHLEAARGEAGAHEDAVRQAASVLSGLLSEVRAYEERQAAMQRDLERLARELNELETRHERGLLISRQAQEDAAALKRAALERAGQLARMRDERATLETEAAAAQERLAAQSAALRALEGRLNRAALELEESRGRREQLGLELERARVELEHLLADCREEMGCLPGELPGLSPAALGTDIPEEEGLLAGRIAACKDRREKVGQVNPLAEQEYEDLTRRSGELGGQKGDLEKSLEQLLGSIRKMDRESRDRFLDAFQAIRRHFREQFAILFRGGKADLRMEDEENPLETGIEILCQPPGKKLQTVSLLSGGEKALAATAVLFAIFKYQPPPFCLLDEVDAPLDDANVGRFADAVRAFTDRTQFILITHNKRSMEIADLLYGVTMPEPGVSRLVSMTLD